MSDEELERILELVRTAQARLEAAEAEARLLRARLDAVLVHVPPLVVVEEGTVVACSAAMERTAGRAASALLGHPVERVLPDAPQADGVQVLVLEGQLAD